LDQEERHEVTPHETADALAELERDTGAPEDRARENRPAASVAARRDLPVELVARAGGLSDVIKKSGCEKNTTIDRVELAPPLEMHESLHDHKDVLPHVAFAMVLGLLKATSETRKPRARRRERALVEREIERPRDRERPRKL